MVLMATLVIGQHGENRKVLVFFFSPESCKEEADAESGTKRE
jgi:hypothetical protein